jgi:hypothetical protein
VQHCSGNWGFSSDKNKYPFLYKTYYLVSFAKDVPILHGLFQASLFPTKYVNLLYRIKMKLFNKNFSMLHCGLALSFPVPGTLGVTDYVQTRINPRAMPHIIIPKSSTEMASRNPNQGLKSGSSDRVST